MGLDKSKIISEHFSQLGKKGDPTKKGFAANPERARAAALKSVEARRRKKELQNGQTPELPR